MDLQKARKDSKINDTSSSPVLNKVITGDSAPNHVLEAKQDSPIETTLADPNNTSEEASIIIELHRNYALTALSGIGP